MQDKAINALLNLNIYPDKPCKINVIDSFFSKVFLTENKAYKLKLEAKYPNLDYSTLDLRKEMCINEASMLLRLAPELEPQVLPLIQLDNGKFKLGGSDNNELYVIIDYILVTKRFEQDKIFENLTSKGELDRFEMMDLAESLALIHKKAEIVINTDFADNLKALANETFDVLDYFSVNIFNKAHVLELKKAFFCTLNKYFTQIQIRQQKGFVKKCHGNLNLSGICMINKKPQIFDPIEFNDKLSNIDILYDLALLLIDLEAQGQRRLSSILFNHYISYTHDFNGVKFMPLFLSLRALEQAKNFAAENLKDSALDYFKIAYDIIFPAKSIIIASGGLSGTGKSRLSRELAPFVGACPGAFILRTDIIRKAILGRLPHEHLHKPDYTPEINKKTYDTIRQYCVDIIASNQSVLIDGIFAVQEERDITQIIAQDLNVPFYGFWMYAPSELRFQRVVSRKRNPSDATLKVAMRQEEMKVGEVKWNKINSAGSREETLNDAKKILGIA